MRHNRHLIGIQHVAHDIGRRTTAAREVRTEILLAIVLQECLQPFIHLRPFTFVGADDHREPLMTQLVRGHAEQPTAAGLVRAEHDHRILHAADGAVDGPGHRVADGQGVQHVPNQNADVMIPQEGQAGEGLTRKALPLP